MTDEWRTVTTLRCYSLFSYIIYVKIWRMMRISDHIDEGRAVCAEKEYIVITFYIVFTKPLIIILLEKYGLHDFDLELFNPCKV